MKNLKKALKFLREIKGSTGLLFHEDCDGACAAAQMIKYLEAKNIKPELFCGTWEEEDFRNFLESKFDNYMLLDICFTEFPDLLKLTKDKKILIIDHHPSKDLSNHGIIHINPRFTDPEKYISASEVCFEVLSNISAQPKEEIQNSKSAQKSSTDKSNISAAQTAMRKNENYISAAQTAMRKNDFSESKWIARLGGVGDRSLEGSDKEIEARDIADAVKTIKKRKGLVSLAKFLSKAKSIDELLYENKFWQLKENIKDEIEKQISEYELVSHGKITFYQNRGKYGLTSIIVNRLLDMYPKRTIIIYRKVKDGWKVSGRSHVHDLSKIFPKAAEGLGHAGGHSVASGGLVSDIEEFKRRCLKMME